MTNETNKINDRIVTLDVAVQRLRLRENALAFAAVNGDEIAIADLSRVQSELAGLASDRSILIAARAQTAFIDADAADEADEAERAEAHDAAVEAAKDALDAARRMDDAISEFLSAGADLDRAEHAAREGARHAGAVVVARIGRSGARAHGAFLLARIADGTAQRRNDPTVSRFVVNAWREYLG